MITALDTNILIDVLESDPLFADVSARAIARAGQLGALIACDVVWAEVATAYDPPGAVLDDLSLVGVRFVPMSADAALRAAAAWAQYRANGGKRIRIAADFLVGGHAAQQADRLLTRDADFHRQHFPGLEVLAPAEFLAE